MGVDESVSEVQSGLAGWCQSLVARRGFQLGTIGLILFAAALMGVETDRALYAANATTFFWLNKSIQTLFVLEILIRLGAHGSKPGGFFRDGWNVFDFLIVAVTLLPAAGVFATVVRLARVLRVLRLVSVSPELRLIVETMLRSVPSLGNVGLLLGILMYIYAVLGNGLFGKSDPEHWGSLGLALLSTFQMLTLEGWVEMQKAVIAEHPYAYAFFGSFVLVAVFVVVNLFIAIVLNNLENAKHAIERENAPPSQKQLRAEIDALREQLDRFERYLGDSK